MEPIIDRYLYGIDHEAFMRRRDLMTRLITAASAIYGTSSGLGPTGEQHEDLTVWVITPTDQVMRFTIPDPTDEDLLELVNLFEANKENPMNILESGLFRFLSGDMIGDIPRTYTIAGVSEETVGAGKTAEAKPVIRFRETPKLFVLNKTNARRLMETLGPETDRWIGFRVTLIAPYVDSFGQVQRAVRIQSIDPSVNGSNGDSPMPTGQTPTPAGPAPATVEDLI